MKIIIVLDYTCSIIRPECFVKTTIAIHLSPIKYKKNSNRVVAT